MNLGIGVQRMFRWLFLLSYKAFSFFLVVVVVVVVGCVCVGVVGDGRTHPHHTYSRNVLLLLVDVN